MFMIMKRAFILTLALCLSALVPAKAQMQALFGYSTFYLPEQDKPYMETYLQFDAWTMQFVQQTNGVYRATVEVTLVVRQADSVCYVKKYDLNSPTVGSLDEMDFSFIDVQRFSLGNGVYNLELSLRDKNGEAPAAVVNEKVVISYDRQHPVISSLQPMAEVSATVKQNILSRGGYDMEPYISDFYPQQVEEMKFYYEVYNIDKELGHKPFVAMAYIEQYETGVRVDGMQAVIRKNSAPLVPVYGTIDISNLPSGNYNLVVELRNRDNQTMLYKKLNFYRSNPGVKGQTLSDFATTFAGKYTDEDEIDTYIDALWPIASEMERNVSKDLIRRVGLLEEKQAFLYRFWMARDPLAPEAAWMKYKEKVDYVQQHFSYPRVPDKPIYPEIKSYDAYEDVVVFTFHSTGEVSKGEVLNACRVNDEKVWEKIGKVKVVNFSEETGEVKCEVRRGDGDVLQALKTSTSIRLVSSSKYTPGIHSDRGRVYLQYGPPDFVRDEKNYVSANRIGEGNIHATEISNDAVQAGIQPYVPNEMYQGNSQGHIYYLPYQLWRYNKLDTDDPNRVFLFWDEHRSGYYTLLNSNARGEVQDPTWERRLSRQQLGENVLGEVGEQFRRGY